MVEHVPKIIASKENTTTTTTTIKSLHEMVVAEAHLHPTHQQ